ncbi:HNH endonuclease [Alteromonas macleodii]|uniref:HNH nuclease domain-containing protein n=1 Tax=Alteromonas macleodii TaxID=28108 RepID=A0A6T9Y505_ALTMA|nr:HNH endonuclease signature motif containing protein [Alteromonas macleodii]CAB9494913.1 protein of unknown function [Alteromonas macleodii]
MQSKQEFFSVCKDKLEPKGAKNRLSVQEINLLSSLYDTLFLMGLDWRFKGVIYSGNRHMLTITPAQKDKKPLFGLIRKSSAKVNDRIFWCYPSKDETITTVLQRFPTSKVKSELIDNQADFLETAVKIVQDPSIVHLYDLKQNSDQNFSQVLVTSRGAKQQKFKANLLTEFSGECAVTGCNIECLLDAAHIIGFAYCIYENRDDTFSTTNGLLLRNDIHRLFDSGYIDFIQKGTDIIVKIAPKLFNFDEYKALDNKKLQLPRERRELWLKTLQERRAII